MKILEKIYFFSSLCPPYPAGQEAKKHKPYKGGSFDILKIFHMMDLICGTAKHEKKTFWDRET